MAASLQADSTTDEPIEAKTLVGEASEAATKFEADFNFRNMDKMIHRFPPRLGEIISSKYSYMVVPTFVAIGPYHREKKHLEKMEAVKKAAAHFLMQSSKNLRDEVMKAAAHYKRGENDLDAAAGKVVEAVNDAHKFYFVTGEGMTKEQFADMMIYDACFLLLYMDAYNRSHKEKEKDCVVNPSMRRFLFSNRDRINNDIMLLENQLPWGVIQVFVDLARIDHQDMNNTVGFFIAAMGSSFKITQSSKLEPYVWDDKENTPPHLLAHLRRHKTIKLSRSKSQPKSAKEQYFSITTNQPNHPKTAQRTEPKPNNTNSPPDPGVLEITIDGDSTLTQESNRDEVVFSAISPMDLDQIGIKLTADPTAEFSDMGLEKRWLWSRLKLAPLSLDETGASWLVNMAAFEVCTASSFGDPHDRTAVSSYLALLAFFMAGSNDVRKLRSMGLLKGPKTDDDMLAFFQTLQQHLPDYGAHFTEVMVKVEEYQRKRCIRTTLYRWVYNNWKTVSAVVPIVVAVATTIAALIRLYQELRSVVHKN